MNLVFASGFLFPQRCMGHDYFRGAREAFPQACFPRVPLLGSIEARAHALADQITRFRFPDAGAKCHVVAHSMGGLDARYALHHDLAGVAARVASLSTIGTPHWGSPIADLLVGGDPGGGTLREALYRTVRRTLAVFGVATGGLYDLTTVHARRFNETHRDIRGIPCFCYAGHGAEAAPLRVMAAYIRRVGRAPDEQDNDGLVSVASASWNGLTEVPWPADHFAEVGHSLVPPRFASTFAHLDALRRIVARAVGPQRAA